MMNLLRCLVLLTCVSIPLVAQSTWMSRLSKDPSTATFTSDLNSSIPTPESVTGYKLGERYGTTAELHAYFEAVATKSSRVKVWSYGTSSLGRALKVAAISDPKNLSNLDGIMERNVAIPMGVKAPADHPLVVFLMAGVHGDEASGGEAMLGLLHFLAADQSAATSELLKRVVVMIDPAQNPDGRDRFVTLSRDREGAKPEADPLSYEHQQPWPGGRTSRDGFDLNRDWFLSTQPETRARLELLNHTCPQVVADLHEMSSDEAYFSSTPPCPPVNEHCSAQVRALWRIVGESIDSHFVAQRTVAFNNALFPLDYPGYGGTYSCMRGACGMTFEQGMPRGRAILRNDGSTLTLADAALHHATASLATLRACATRRDEILETYQNHFAKQLALASSDTLPVFVIPPSVDPLVHAEFRDLLIRNAIQASITQSPMTVEAFGLDGAESTKTTFPVGTIVVSTAQPFRPLVKTLLDPLVVMEDSFRKEEESRLLRGEKSQVYDVTAWNVPLGFGLKGYRIAKLPEGISMAQATSERTKIVVPSVEAAMAVVVPGDGIGAARVLAAWWKNGIQGRIATKSFSTSGQSFVAGSLVALAERNSEERLALAASEAARVGVMPTVLASLATESGPSLGTSMMKVVTQPRIALAYGQPLDVTSAGALRRFLQVEIGIDLVTAPLDRPLARILSQSDVLILPDGDSDALAKALVDADLKGFVERGGTVVAVKGAVFALEKMGLVDIQHVAAPAVTQAIHGPFVNAHVESESWVGLGIPSTVHVQARIRSIWNTSQSKNTLVRFLGGRALSGELPTAKEAILAGSTFVGSSKLGQGVVLSLAEDPSIRGATPGLHRLLANIILLGPAFGR